MENVAKVVVDDAVVQGDAQPYIVYENAGATRAAGEAPRPGA
jgi:ATP-dependent Clp protease ATP-binding subunit ClpX